jgi:hypothetical protein
MASRGIVSGHAKIEMRAPITIPAIHFAFDKTTDTNFGERGEERVPRTSTARSAKELLVLLIHYPLYSLDLLQYKAPGLDCYPIVACCDSLNDSSAFRCRTILVNSNHRQSAGHDGSIIDWVVALIFHRHDGHR